MTTASDITGIGWRRRRTVDYNLLTRLRYRCGAYVMRFFRSDYAVGDTEFGEFRAV